MYRTLSLTTVQMCEAACCTAGMQRLEPTKKENKSEIFCAKVEFFRGDSLGVHM